jgi:hypothetical protein
MKGWETEVGRNLLIESKWVLHSDYWPFAYYLQRFTQGTNVVSSSFGQWFGERKIVSGKYSRKATRSKTLSNWFDVDLVPVDPSFILSLNVMKCLERRKWWKECAD